jgi:FrmR/RcnR family transcriptional regulator, repressor of frmRAB operon
MAHTIRDKKKLLNRVRRVRGQVEAVERLLENENECSEILQQIAACRGSINALMSEVLEGHIRFHLVERRENHKAHKGNAVEEVISIAKSYLK